MKIQNQPSNFQFSSPDDPKRPNDPPPGWDPVRDVYVYVPRTPSAPSFAASGAFLGAGLGVFAGAARGAVPAVLPAAMGCLAGAGAVAVLTKVASGKNGPTSKTLAGAAVVGGLLGALAGTGAPSGGSVLLLALAGGVAGGYGTYKLGQQLFPQT